ncbi:hypothetical protein C8Q77DRAFT_730634 [Trametes polyzona]|nr:hypothetical protein C8Q77DRAFT_730634 [Trametes polyzona]
MNNPASRRLTSLPNSVASLYAPNDRHDPYSVEFCNAVDSRRVHSTREFYLRLIAPAVFEECATTNARSFICFSSLPPCNPIPPFTQPLSLRMTKADAELIKSRRDMADPAWFLGLCDMSMQEFYVNKRGKKVDKGQPIPLLSIREILKQEDRVSRVGLGIPVLLDSGTVRSRLPVEIVEEIAAKWLLNDRKSKGAVKLTSDQHPYHDPRTRDLNKFDIIFTFWSIGTDRCSLRCPAEPFLSSAWPLDVNTPISRHMSSSGLLQTSLTAVPEGDVYVLGMVSSYLKFVHMYRCIVAYCLCVIGTIRTSTGRRWYTTLAHLSGTTLLAPCNRLTCAWHPRGSSTMLRRGTRISSSGRSMSHSIQGGTRGDNRSL